MTSPIDDQFESVDQAGTDKKVWTKPKLTLLRSGDTPQGSVAGDLVMNSGDYLQSYGS